MNYDSPEAFEEVFWMTFSSPPYVKPDHLEIQAVDDELVKKYIKYVKNIILSHGGEQAGRYLAKNNNHLIRIDTIKQAFPDAIIVVPFRHPVSHAMSLQKQHENFLERHSEDHFSQKYMNWLGHFEFGANFKPFKTHERALPADELEPLTLDYWLRYWKEVYTYLIERYASQLYFFSHDKLCENPGESLDALEAALMLSDVSLKKFAAKIHQKPQMGVLQLQPDVKTVYNKLMDISIQ